MRASGDTLVSGPLSLTLPLTGGQPALEEGASLVERLRRGDADALTEAYDAHGAHVQAFARRFLGDAAAADDLVQETFVALRSAIRSFAGDASLRTFLVSIAVNRGRHHVRAAARRRAAALRLGESPPRQIPTPEDQLQRVQLAEAISRALDRLPMDQRVAFVLFEVEERTSGEVAAIVGASEVTVRARVWHARRKIRELLTNELSR
jgi:RNA polymerase sigma-70 factor (ECF subfamily)